MNLLLMLKGGDLRSTGRSDEIANLVLKKSLLFPELINLINSDEPVVRMRAADAVEKVTLKRPELLQPYKKLLIEASSINQQEVKWHLAQLYPRLELSSSEKENITNLLLNWLESDKSNIVRVFSLQALYDMKYAKIKQLITKCAKSKVPSILSRARRLLKE